MPAPSPFNTAKTRVGTSFRRFSSLLLGLFFLVVLSILTAPRTVHADTDSDRELLELYYEPHDLTVTSATRSPRPLSRSAENITVISADEIEALNAHTLADVLEKIPGVQVAYNTAPGAAAGFEFAGATTRHIQVLIDGVPLNDQLDNFALVGGVPVQIIERIEIVKSPVSSAWSSALGGVVNIVTKEPSQHGPFTGSASFSGGENGTRDARGEFSGTIDRFGYYLSGGNLQSNGFRPFSATENNNLYAKLRWNLSDGGSVRLTVNYLKTAPQEAIVLDLISSRLTNRQLQSTLALDYALTDRLTFNAMLKGTRLDYNRFVTLLATGEPYLPRTVANDEKTVGGATTLTWRQGLHTLTGGVEFDHGSSEFIKAGVKTIDVTNDKYSFFLNDTIAWERFTLTPAVRYELTSHAGDHFSPSLGATLSLTDKTLLRFYTASGYSMPLLNPDYASQERGWTLQAGIESSEIPYLWLKGTWFRNTVDRITAYEYNTDTWEEIRLSERHVREGVEVQAKTASLFNSWFTAGYVFTDAKNRRTGDEIPGVARHTWDLGLHYDDRTFRGAVTGHFRWWNNPGGGGQYKDFIWDLNAGWRFYQGRNAEAELFVTGHNLFDGKQYPLEPYVNPDRWFEGGLRIKW
uniref:TonB-dependent receptor n=1 Tax=Geobacter metallireducens TaxID=28232 RepID=A0A831UAL1_GEOME